MADKGRPKLEEGTAKSHVVQFRCDDAEFKQLKEAAAAEGRTLSAWMRRRLLGEERDEEPGEVE